jgi:hypothetical protein
VTINVIRNNIAPQWESTNYKQSIQEILSVNSNVIVVRATDPDRVFNVVKYEIIGDDKSTAYFKIGEDSGQIQVSASIAGIQEEIFYVSLHSMFLIRAIFFTLLNSFVYLKIKVSSIK